MENGIKARIESEIDVKAYIQNLQFSLNNGAKIEFQGKRFVDEDRDERYTNQYTVNVLFPNENPVDVLRRELLKLSVSDYMRTVKMCIRDRPWIRRPIYPLVNSVGMSNSFCPMTSTE